MYFVYFAQFAYKASYSLQLLTLFNFSLFCLYNQQKLLEFLKESKRHPYKKDVFPQRPHLESTATTLVTYFTIKLIGVNDLQNDF